MRALGIMVLIIILYYVLLGLTLWACNGRKLYNSPIKFPSEEVESL